MKRFKWDESKNVWLQENRKISFEEKEILEAFEDNRLDNAEMSAEELEDLKLAAKATLHENNRISVRIPPRDLNKIKKRATASGIPYQTLITAVLHQYAEGKIRASI